MANDNKEFDFRKLFESTKDLRRRVLEGQEPVRAHRLHSEWNNVTYTMFYDDNKGTWWITDESKKEVARGEYGGAGASKIDHIDAEVINLLFELFTEHGDDQTVEDTSQEEEVQEGTLETCPVCLGKGAGKGKFFDKGGKCVPCKGTGKQPVGGGSGRYESPEETAEAEGTSVEAEKAAARRAGRWIQKHRK